MPLRLRLERVRGMQMFGWSGLQSYLPDTSGREHGRLSSVHVCS